MKFESCQQANLVYLKSPDVKKQSLRGQNIWTGLIRSARKERTSFLFSLRQNKTFPESFNDNKLCVTYLDMTIMEKHWAHC